MPRASTGWPADGGRIATNLLRCKAAKAHGDNYAPRMWRHGMTAHRLLTARNGMRAGLIGRSLVIQVTQVG